MSATSKVQANVNSQLKSNAEEIIKEVGLTPTAVINSLYAEIVATGKIPLSFSLTPQQKADIELREASKLVPIKELKSQKDYEDFFNED